MTSYMLSQLGRKKLLTIILAAFALSGLVIPCWASAPGIKLGLNTGNLGMMSMGTATLTVTATPVGGVTLSADAVGAGASIVAGLPTGFTALWSGPTLSGGAMSWTLTLTGGVNAIASSGTLELAARITDANTGTVYSASEEVALSVTFSVPKLSVSPALTTIPLVQGTSATDVLTFTGSGSFQGPVSLSVSGLPSGVTASWSGNPVTLISGTGSSTLTLAASAAAPVNWYAFTVTATGDGLTMSRSYAVEVQQAPGMNMKLSQSSLSMTSMGSATVTVTATPVGGVTVPAGAAGARAAIVSGLLSGVTAAWSSPSLSGGAVSWVLTLTGGTAAVGGAGTLKLAAQITDANSGIVYSASQGEALKVTFSAPTLNILPATYTVPVVQGASATNIFNLTSGGSFQGPVTLTVSGLPSGVTASWSSSPVTLASGAGSSTLTLAASTAAQVNYSVFTVTATGDGLTVARSYGVQVEQAPGARLQLNTGNLSMVSMGSGTVTVTATPIGGVAVAAGASPSILSGLPAGITGAWSGATLSGGAVSWTLTLTGGVNAIASNGTLELSAQITDANTGIAYSASAGVALSVTLTPPTLSFSPALPAVAVEQGSSVTDAFTLMSGGSYQGPVTLAVSGLPGGVTASWSSNPVTPVAGAGSSTLTLAVGASVTVNYYSFTVTATGDGLTVSRSYTVEIGPAVGVQIQLSQSSTTIQSPGIATVMVTAVPTGGVTLPAGGAGASVSILSALPAGITAGWSGATVTAAGGVSWTLTLTAASTALAGGDPIDLSVQVTDATRGLVYSASKNFTLLVALLADVSIGSTPGQAIPATFMGLSHEWDIVTMMGTSATGINPIYRQLLKNLTLYGSGPINVRIGGESTDYSAEPTPTTAAPFAQVAQAVGAQFELGVNLGSDNVGLATNQATAFASQMPAGSLLALEVGNEPDLYYENGYRTEAYTLQDYFADFSAWEQSIMPVLPAGVKLMGPVWASPGMLPQLPSFLSQFSSDLAAVSQHSYGASYSSNPPADVLLIPGTATTIPAEVAGAVTETHALGIPFRIGEMNSVDDGGIEGISDTFSVALWAVDEMFQFANVGVDGVNWSATDRNYYNPFNFTIDALNGMNTYTLSYIRPLYYGLVMFQAATGNQAQLLPVNLSTPANLTAWATIDASSIPRLVIINKDEVASGTVQVNLLGYNQASVYFLQAPSYTSTTGVTFGGQTFDGSTDGTIQGTPAPAIIQGNNGVFSLNLGITSAALVVFSH